MRKNNFCLKLVNFIVGGGMSGSMAGSRLVGPGGAEQHCCLMDSGKRCLKPAGNASYSKRIQKTVTQKNMKLSLDQENNSMIIFWHNIFH